jgi:hypothetical protein
VLSRDDIPQEWHRHKTATADRLKFFTMTRAYHKHRCRSTQFSSGMKIDVLDIFWLRP